VRADELMARAAALGLNIERATDIKGTTVPEWTAEDAAHACGGLPDRYYYAFAYRFAGDDAVRSGLWGALMSELGRLAAEERWTAAQLHCDGFRWRPLYELEPEGSGLMRGIRREGKKWVPTPVDLCLVSQWEVYAPARVAVLPRLVDLVLTEEYLATRYPRMLALVRQVEAWPDLVGFGRQHWHRHGERQFEAARSIFEEWCGTAYSHVARRIREEHDCDAA
jgi:hypothetical protein